jgi:hypothetical protein
MYIWTEEQIDQAAEKIDLLIKAKGIVEMLDGPAAKAVLNLANRMAFQYAPTWTHGMIGQAMITFLEWEIPSEELPE